MIKEITGIITFGNIEPAYTKTSFCIKPNSDNINSISPNIASLVKPTRINKNDEITVINNELWYNK